MVDKVVSGDGAKAAASDGRAQAPGMPISSSKLSFSAKGEPAIAVDRVSKRFRLYHERNDSIKATIMRGRRARYEEFWAIDDVSFDIKEGETFGIIGENGSGKSTMLKCMARILRPDKGAVRVNGKVSALLELGAGFHPELSGRENVYLNGSILGLSKRQLDDKFDEIVEFAGLEKFIDQPVKNYSSGMYVRLGFSVAINVNPDVLLVDEVLAVGDEVFQRRCAEKFSQMQDAGKTIVIVSHAMGSVRSMCDRLAWMDHGKLKMVGPSTEVIDEYLGTVHVEQLQTAETKGLRWGDGRAKLDAIELVDAKGRKIERVKTGDSATIRLRYTIKGEPIPRGMLGFALHRIDGVHITGVNIHEYPVVPDLLAGSGSFDYVIDTVNLLPGTYDISAAINDAHFVHTFDNWRNGCRFEVDPAIVHESEGVLTFLGHWEHHKYK